MTSCRMLYYTDKFCLSTLTESAQHPSFYKCYYDISEGSLFKTFPYFELLNPTHYKHTVIYH